MSHKNPRGRGGPANHQYTQRSRSDSEDDTTAHAEHKTQGANKTP